MRTRLAASSLLTLALVGLTGCGQTLEPKLELKRAATQLSESEQAQFTISFAGDPASFAELYRQGAGAQEDLVHGELDEAGAPAPDAEYTLTDEDRKQIASVLGVELVVGYDRKGEGTEDDSSRIALRHDGTDALDVRVVEGDVFVRSDFRTAAASLGMEEEYETSLATAEETLPALAPALRGEWVGADLQELLTLAGENGAPVETTTLESEKYAQELSAAAERVLKNAKVSRAEDGHIVAEISSAAVATEVATIAGALSEGLVDPYAAEAEDVPVRVDIWVEDGRFQAFELDLAQFAETDKERAAVRVEVETDAPIERPDAEVLDVEETFGAVMEASKASSARVTLESVDRNAMALGAFENTVPTRTHVEDAAKESWLNEGDTLTFVGERLELHQDGVYACLAVSSELGTSGTVTDGTCDAAPATNEPFVVGTAAESDEFWAETPAPSDEAYETPAAALLASVDRNAMALSAFDQSAPRRADLEASINELGADMGSVRLLEDDRVEADVDGDVACLTVSTEQGMTGTIVPGACA